MWFHVAGLLAFLSVTSETEFVAVLKKNIYFPRCRWCCCLGFSPLLRASLHIENTCCIAEKIFHNSFDLIN